MCRFIQLKMNCFLVNLTHHLPMYCLCLYVYRKARAIQLTHHTSIYITNGVELACYALIDVCFKHSNSFRLLPFVSIEFAKQRTVCIGGCSVCMCVCVCLFHEWLISISPCDSIFLCESKLVVANDCVAPAHDHSSSCVCLFLWFLARPSDKMGTFKILGKMKQFFCWVTSHNEPKSSANDSKNGRCHKNRHLTTPYLDHLNG